MYDHRETVLDFTSYRETDVKSITRKLTSCDNFIKVTQNSFRHLNFDGSL